MRRMVDKDSKPKRRTWQEDFAAIETFIDATETRNKRLIVK